MPSPQASVRLSRSRSGSRCGAGAAVAGSAPGSLRGRARAPWHARMVVGAAAAASGGDAPARPPPCCAASRRWRVAAPPPPPDGAPAAAPVPRLAAGGRSRRRPERRTSPGRRSGPWKGGRSGLRTLQDADPLRQRLHSGIEVRSHGTHHGDLEHHLRVGCLTHVDQRVAEDLHAAHHPGQSHRLGQAAEPLERRSGHRAQLGRQRGEEDLAEVVDQLCGQLLWAPTTGQQRAQRDEHPG